MEGGGGGAGWPVLHRAGVARASVGVPGRLIRAGVSEEKGWGFNKAASKPQANTRNRP